VVESGDVYCFFFPFFIPSFSSFFSLLQRHQLHQVNRTFVVPFPFLIPPFSFPSLFLGVRKRMREYENDETLALPLDDSISMAKRVERRMYPNAAGRIPLLSSSSSLFFLSPRIENVKIRISFSPSLKGDVFLPSSFFSPRK